MTLTDIVGYAAAAGTTLAFVPQVRHVWRTRSTRDISLTTFAVMCVGVALWLVFGLMIHSPPIVIANGTTLVLCSIILWFKLQEKR